MFCASKQIKSIRECYYKKSSERDILQDNRLTTVTIEPKINPFLIFILLLYTFVLLSQNVSIIHIFWYFRRPTLFGSHLLYLKFEIDSFGRRRGWRLLMFAWILLLICLLLLWLGRTDWLARHGTISRLSLNFFLVVYTKRPLVLLYLFLSLELIHSFHEVLLQIFALKAGL